MLYQGYKITVSCINWEQVKILGSFWNFCRQFVPEKDLVGLGFNWVNDKQFDYALGAINDPTTLSKLKAIDFSRTSFQPIYFEVELPDLVSWQSFSGKTANLRQIYEEQVDRDHRPYDYELEYFDGEALEIKIHYLDEPAASML